MEVIYSYKSIGESHADARVPDNTPSIEVLPADMDLLKEAARLHLKALKPTSRMEIVARAFSYRTAASLQAAIKAATPENPLVLTPRIGAIDPYRLEQLETLSREMNLGPRDRKNMSPHMAFDQARDIASAVVAHIRRSRGVSDDFIGSPHSPRDRACVILGLPGRRCRHIEEELIPQIDLCLHPATAVTDNPDLGERHIPTGSVIHLLGGVRALDAVTHEQISAKLGVDPSRIIPEAKFERNRAQGTFLYKNSSGAPEAFMTVTFEHSFADEDSARYFLEDEYGISEDDVEWDELCEMARAISTQMWRLEVTIHDVGYAPGTDVEVTTDAIHLGLGKVISSHLMAMGFAARKGAGGLIEIGVETFSFDCKERVEIWKVDEFVAEEVVFLNEMINDNDEGETDVTIRSFSEEASELEEAMKAL